jgi:hypothetical protein
MQKKKSGGFMNDYAKFYQPIIKHYSPMYNKGGRSKKIRKNYNKITKRRNNKHKKTNKRKY